MRKAHQNCRRTYKGHHRKPGAAVRLAAAVTSAAAGITVAGTALSAPPAQALTVPTGGQVPAAVIAERQAPEQATVASGDTLSAIAARYCGTPDDWLGIWHASRGIPDPDDIAIGQQLVIACNASGPGYTPPAPPAPAVITTAIQQPAPQYQRPAAETVSTAGDGSFASCVIARESGGNSQVMNSTGHYGLYQFSAGTWAAYGGDPADFGDASVAEQNQVFSNAMATPGGASNWSPYDGC